MKKVLFVLAGLMVAACLSAGNLFAAEARPMSEQEVAALEAQLFVNVDKMDTSDGAKFAQQLIAGDDANSDAKCWFWGWRYSSYYYYPTYYYYTWYVPCYYVSFRLVSYTVPTVETVSTTTVSSSTTIIAKSSGKVGSGAVIDQKVPADSPLARMGLRSGDIITSVDGNPVTALVDVRRIKDTSHVTYVRGDVIRVAGKPLLQRTNATVEKSNAGMTQSPIDLNVVKSVQDKKISLYEYYDMQEKAGTSQAPKTPAREYGADQY